MVLQVDVQQIRPGTTVVSLSGALTLGTSLQIADAKIQQALHAETPKLILNMSGVPYMDSAGLGALVHASGVAQEHGGAMRLCAVTDRVASMLKMTRTDRLLPTDPDVNASLAALA